MALANVTDPEITLSHYSMCNNPRPVIDRENEALPIESDGYPPEAEAK